VTRGVTTCLLVLLSPLALGAQQECEFLAPSGNFSSSNGVTRVSTPHVLCPDGTRIRADSLRRTDSSGYHEFFGSVLFEDPARILRSARAQYFANTGRLQAQDGVRLTRRVDNALITGENLIYDVGDGQTTEDRLVVTGGRPHAVLHTSAVDTVRPGDPLTGDPQAAPYEVDADRIAIEGADGFDASGNVRITRDSLEAYGDRSVFEQEEGTLVLLGNAVLIEGGSTLEGDTIDLVLPEDVIREIIARRRAVLNDQDLDLRAPFIRILMADGQMDRMVAVGDTGSMEPRPDALSGASQPPAPAASLLLADHPARPVVRTEDFLIIADSVDVLLPGERLESLTAVGDAHAESTARDSLNTASTPDVIRRDWIDGQTIVATFASVPATGTEGVDPTGNEYRLERLVSSGLARSLYRMAASDSTTAEFQGERRPAVHYVGGDTIVLVLEEGAIQSMDVVNQVRGWHFEPIDRGGRAPPAESPTDDRAPPSDSPDGGPPASPAQSDGGRPPLERETP